PALAFGVNYSVFKEPLLDSADRSTNIRRGVSNERRADTHLSPRSAAHPGPVGRRWEASERRPCQSAPGHPRADWSSYEPAAVAATRSGDFLAPGRALRWRLPC